MASIIALVEIGIFFIGVFIALFMRMGGNTELKGKYNPKTQKVFLFLFCTPIYLILSIQIMNAFTHFNPPAILY